MSALILLANVLGDAKDGYGLKKHVGLVSGKSEMHNNLVYPLLRRFVGSGWVSKRKGAGQRGRTREIYALTNKGRQELLRRLSHFTSKEAASESGFHLRVGLFSVLDAGTSGAILTERDEWLTAREQRLQRPSPAPELRPLGGAGVDFI